MAKVFVTQEKGFDFTKAEAFGELVFMTDLDFWNNKKSGHNARLVEKLVEKLALVDFENDSFILVGSDMVIAAVFMLVGRAGIRRVNILRWSSRDQIYEPAEIDVSGARI